MGKFKRISKISEKIENLIFGKNMKRNQPVSSHSSRDAGSAVGQVGRKRVEGNGSFQKNKQCVTIMLVFAQQQR